MDPCRPGKCRSCRGGKRRFVGEAVQGMQDWAGQGTGCKFGSAVGEQDRVNNSARQGGVDELGQRWAGFQVQGG